MRFLKACAIGCGVLLALGAVSCIGFVVWVNQPGEMADAGLLVGADTTGFVVWTLSLDDPGTAALVDQLLAVLARGRGRMETPLPPVLDRWIKGWQQARDARKLRELFPLAVAWSMRPNHPAAGDLHLLAVSIERLGNRGVLVDWVLGWILGRSHEVDVVRHRGEQIFAVDTGAAFFLRGSNLLLASDVDSARMAVDRLWRETTNPAAAGELDGLLAEASGDAPLHGVVLNRDGCLQRVVRSLADGEVPEPLAEWPWHETAAATLRGGFTSGSAFRATVTVHSTGSPWGRTGADQLVAALHRVTADVVGAEVRGRVDGQRLEVELLIDDLPGRVEQWFADAMVSTGRELEDRPLEAPDAG
jgi:hypothetical protein